MQISLKSQSSLEYLLVMGIGIFILVAAISYAIYYQVGYNSAGSVQNLQLAATSISNAVNAVSNSGIGSIQQFTFTSSGLDLTSSICNTSLSLNYAGKEASQSLQMYTTGVLPINPGTYTAYVKSVKVNGITEAQLSVNLPISYISTSYIYNPSSIFYNVSFLDGSDNLVGNVNFTLIIYNNDKIIAEQNETTISGYYSGSISPSSGQFLPNSVAEIYVSSLGIISPSCFLPQELLVVPSNIINYVPLTITNSQNAPTVSPFQQKVVIDSAEYQQYEASNLSNVEFFYPNGTVINSWLESGNSNTAASTIYWLKISGILAHSSETVYLGFASKSTNLFNTTNDGEAPQLSSTYAEYDDGANVFNFYDNFAGTALSSQWTSSSTSSYSIKVDDGLTISLPSGAAAGGAYVNSVNAVVGNNIILQGLINQGDESTTNERGLIGASISNSVYQVWDNGGSSGDTIVGWSAGKDNVGNIIQAMSVLNGAYTYLNSISSNSNLNIYSVFVSDSTVGTYVNDGSVSTTTTDVPPKPLYISLSDYSTGGGAAVNSFYQWIRTRAYPPNGVMPSVTIGSVQPQIVVFVNGVKDGNNGIADSTTMNITAFGIKSSHIGLMINGTIVSQLGSASLSYQKPMSPGLYNITVFSNQSNLANQTYWEAVAAIPKGITNFVPVSITNQQNVATPAVFQQNLSIDSFLYKNFENSSLNNVEFFSPSGSTISSWLQSGDIAYFNGSAYAVLPENYPYNMGTSFTISVWFKTTGQGVIIGNGNSANPGSSGCYSPTIFVNKNGDIAGGDWIGSEPFDTNYFVANGKWTEVTITQTPTEQILYVNGNEIASASGTPQACSPTYWSIGTGHSGWVGTDTSSPEYNFTGSISNVQFYNQVFTPSKVASLYDKGLAASPLTNSGLIAWYLLSGNVSQQNGHNAPTVTGSIQFKGVSSASTSTNYWIKTGSIQPRESYIVFVGFSLPNVSLFNNTNDGEAPQLSSTYGEYDNGKNVFLEYGNFVNGMGFDGWTEAVTSGSFTPLATNEGIEMINDTGGEGTHITPPNPLVEEPVIAEYSWKFSEGPSDGEILSLFGNPSSLTGPPVVTCGGGNLALGDSVMLMLEEVGMNCSGKYIPAILDNVNDKIISTVNNLPSITPQNYTERLTIVNSTFAEAGAFNFSEVYPVSEFSSLNIPINMEGVIPSVFNYPTMMIAAGSGGGYTYQYIQWAVVRAYPPNGIMPVETSGYINGNPN
jgi:hypothetical protein